MGIKAQLLKLLYRRTQRPRCYGEVSIMCIEAFDTLWLVVFDRLPVEASTRFIGVSMGNSLGVKKLQDYSAKMREACGCGLTRKKVMMWE